MDAERNTHLLDGSFPSQEENDSQLLYEILIE